MSGKFKLYIKTDGKFIVYGCGNMTYIRELLYDYLVKNDMYCKGYYIV